MDKRTDTNYLEYNSKPDEFTNYYNNGCWWITSANPSVQFTNFVDLNILRTFHTVYHLVNRPSSVLIDN